MKIKNSKIEIVNILIAVICLITIVGLFVYFGSANCFKYEDITEPFLIPKNLREMYVVANHGCFISTVVYQFICFLMPKMFKMHPNDFLFIYVFEGFIYWLIPLLLARFAVSYSKKKYFLQFYIIANCLFFMIFINYGCLFLQYGFIYSRFIRYVFSMIFLVFFWNLFSNFYLFNRYKAWQFYFAAFCVGISVEPLNVTTFFGLFVITILSLLNKEMIKKTLSNQYIFMLFSFFAGLILFFMNPNFCDIAASRGINGDSEIFYNLVFNFSSFNLSFLNNVIIENINYLVVIVLLSAALIIKYIRDRDIKNIKILIISLGLLVGVLLFNYILIFPGRTFYDGANFWLRSVDVKIDTAFVLILIIIIMSSYIFSILRNEFKKVFIALLVGFVVYNYIHIYKIDIEKFFVSRENSYNSRQIMYKTEKIYRFYYLENYKRAYLPVSAINKPDLLYIFDSKLNKNLAIAIKEARFPVPYYSKIYDVPARKMIKIKLVDDKTAFKKFHDIGGSFTEEELKELKFTKLLDKDFVLGKNKL